MYELDDSFVAHDADVFDLLKQMVNSIEVRVRVCWLTQAHAGAHS